ncbi:MAG: YggS family pyridoxal phosphate-dependent enzyme [Betaproteobacteria bacterium]|nr:YggS family pyridoxal phosphate-dependent enzyme [Betaproteobacteria bacterium]
MSASDGSIPQNLATVHARIRDAERLWGRTPGSVSLLAVSKTFGVDAVVSALAAGQLAFGENYAQEGIEKIAALEPQGPRPANASGQPCWHFIGPLQSNKTRAVAEHFDWVHTIDRERIGRRLAEQRPAALGPLQVCIQINVSGEATKSGCAPQEALALVESLLALPALRLRGVMAIPEATPEITEQRAAFARARGVFELIRDTFPGVSALRAWDTLSMGMSADLESAIAEGATLVRVGSAIFGSRAPRPE